MTPRVRVPVSPALAVVRIVRRRHAATLAAALALLAACDRPPSADSVPEWTKADHHSNDDDRAGQTGQAGKPGRAAGANGGAGADQVTQLVDLTWRQQCSGCHGALGRGDGQLAAMVQAPDLTRAEFQSKTTDAEMAAVIKTGRNKMPRFDLPAPVIGGLVARIRALGGGSGGAAAR
jgi:cytochrome c oxidase cbb3-type subunit 3